MSSNTSFIEWKVGYCIYSSLSGQPFHFQSQRVLKIFSFKCKILKEITKGSSRDLSFNLFLKRLFRLERRRLESLSEREEEALGGIRPDFGLFACLTQAPKPSCPVLTGWHHHLLISSRSFHRLMDKAVGQGSGWQGGLWACCLAAEAVFTLRCLWAAPRQQPAWPFWIQQEGKGEKNMGQRENRRKRWGRRRGGAMSCLWPERREGPRDMTDYRRGQSSRPMPRPQLSVMGAGRGMWGAERGRKQERQVLVKESGKKRREKKRKKIPFERILRRNVQICVVACSFRCWPLIIKHTTALTHTHLKTVPFFTT